MKRNIYPMRLSITEDWGINIIPPIDIDLFRVVSDWGTLLKDVIEEDIREGGLLDDHEKGEFDCLVLWYPHVHHSFEGDEYDLDFEILKEKKVEEKEIRNV